MGWNFVHPVQLHLGRLGTTKSYNATTKKSCFILQGLLSFGKFGKLHALVLKVTREVSALAEPRYLLVAEAGGLCVSCVSALGKVLL